MIFPRAARRSPWPYLLMLACAVLPMTASAEEQKEGENVTEAMRAAQEKYKITSHYVHTWQPMPSFTARQVITGESFRFAPARGEASVLIFVASWCLPCQRLIGEFRKLEEAYARLNTRFVYIFANDTLKDAQGFASTYKLGPNAVMADHTILDAYHQPELPTIYVGDRQTWMTLRLVNTQREDLARLDGFLKRQTSF